MLKPYFPQSEKDMMMMMTLWLQAPSHFFAQRTNKELPTHILTRLAEFVLTLNALLFSGKYYHQIGGMAIGSKYGQIRARYTGFVSPLQRPLHSWSWFKVLHRLRTQLSSSHIISVNWIAVSWYPIANPWSYHLSVWECCVLPKHRKKWKATTATF